MFENVNGPLSFEAYGLLGVGDVENHFPSTLAANPGTTGTIEGDVVRYGVQGAFGLTTSYFDLIFSTRISSLNYNGITGSLVFGGEDQVAYLNRETRHTLLEPAATMRFGAEYLKIQIQVGKSHNLTTSDFPQDEGHFSLGVVLYPRRGLILP